ncbi:MAG: flagellar basal body L-ring protein FlgH [Gammaproteobacteria bacterium]|nr:flagellar basal body L-ring protein FlgH [Gammaproteobacteria bacterium]
MTTKNYHHFFNILIVVSSVLLSGCITHTTVRPDANYAPPVIAEPTLGQAMSGSIYSVSNGVRLFEDTKAFRVGDILSVLLSENTNASKSAKTNTKKEDGVSLGAPILLGEAPTKDGTVLGATSIEGDREFKGSGDSSQSNSLTGVITVMVHAVLPNGYLVIRGEKIIGINQGAEYVRLSGIVRPQDIGSDNQVQSSKIASAQMFYGGGGIVAESNEQGWGTRFLNSKWMPF